MASRSLRVLVTGGAGFIGSHVVEELLRRGHNPVVLDDLSVGRAANLPAKVDLVQGDVCDWTAVRPLVKDVDAIIHLAARVTIRGSVEHFADDARVNVMGTVNVIRALTDQTPMPKLIFASSMAVYGDDISLPIDEQAPRKPTSPYGIGKLAAEMYCLQLGRLLGFKSVALRYFNTFGPRQTPTPYVGVITVFTRRLLGGLQPAIFGDGEQQRDFVSVHDVAWATVQALEADVSDVALNVGSGRGTTVNALAAELIRRLRPEATPIFEPVRPEEQRSSIADIGLAQRLLGYCPRHGLLDGLEEVITWCREQPTSSNPDTPEGQAAQL